MEKVVIVTLCSDSWLEEPVEVARRIAQTFAERVRALTIRIADSSPPASPLLGPPTVGGFHDSSIRAITSLWLDAIDDSGAILQFMSENLPGEHCAFLVTESALLEQGGVVPEDGCRSEGKTLGALLRRNPELPESEFTTTWELHSANALAQHPLKGYLRNRVVRRIFGRLDLDGIVEETVASVADFDPESFYLSASHRDQADTEISILFDVNNAGLRGAFMDEYIIIPKPWLGSGGC